MRLLMTVKVRTWFGLVSIANLCTTLSYWSLFCNIGLNLQFHLASMPNGAWVVHILPCEKLELKSLSHFIQQPLLYTEHQSLFFSENCLAFFSAAMDAASINLPDCVEAASFFLFYFSYYSSLLLVCQQHEKRDRSNGRSEFGSNRPSFFPSAFTAFQQQSAANASDKK